MKNKSGKSLKRTLVFLLIDNKLIENPISTGKMKTSMTITNNRKTLNERRKILSGSKIGINFNNC